MQAGQGIFPPCKAKNRSNTWCIARFFPGAKSRLRRLRLDAPAGAVTRQGGKRPGLTASDGCEYRFYSNHQNWRHTAGRGAFSAAEAPKTQEALMAFKFLGQRQLGKLPSRWVSTILMVAIRALPSPQRNGATNILPLTPPAGNQIRRRPHPTKGREPPAGNWIRRRHLLSATKQREKKGMDNPRENL